MSAAAFVPLLPSELWQTVFRIAAGEPSTTFDTSPLPSFSTTPRAWNTPARPYNWDPEYKEYFQRIDTKCQIVLVSRHWRNLALDLLYEYVVLTTTPALLSFMYALEAGWRRPQKGNEESSSGSSRYGGWFTKRLNISFRAVDSSLRTNIQKMAPAFRLCDNLDILDINYHADGVDPRDNEFCHSPILHEIICVGSRLRCIRWKSLASQSYHLFQLLQNNSQSLEALPFALADEPPPRNFTPLSGITFPKVHSLDIAYIRRFDSWLPDCNFPALKELHVTPSMVFQLFTSYAPNITTLDLDSANPATITIEPSLWNSLEALILTHVDLPWLPNKRRYNLPPIANIGIYWNIGFRSCDLCDTDDLVELMNNFTNTLHATRWSELKCVRFVDVQVEHLTTHNVWRESQMEQWEEWIEKWASVNIRFEFGDGGIVKVPPSVRIGKDDDETNTHESGWDGAAGSMGPGEGSDEGKESEMELNT
jgi:hypothetical protein